MLIQTPNLPEPDCTTAYCEGFKVRTNVASGGDGKLSVSPSSLLFLSNVLKAGDEFQILDFPISEVGSRAIYHPLQLYTCNSSPPILCF
jgi:hypothetical protein